MLISAKSGTRNQKIGSCEPRRRSFRVKSMADSVPLPPIPKRPFDSRFDGATLDAANVIAKILRAKMNNGNEDLKQRSKDSAKEMKVPAFG